MVPLMVHILSAIVNEAVVVVIVYGVESLGIAISFRNFCAELSSCLESNFSLHYTVQLVV